MKKNVFFRALPELPKPPLPWPQFGQLGPLFSGRQNNVLRVLQEKSTNDDNDNCHDNHDSNDGKGWLPIAKLKKIQDKIVRFGCNLGQMIGHLGWLYNPGCTQIGQC